MLADQARVEQLMLLGRVPGLLRRHCTWTDSEGRPWGGKSLGGHWFAVCGVGPGWIFDPHGAVRRADELSRLREATPASSAEFEQQLAARITHLRLGPQTERLYWSVYRRLLGAKRSVFSVPDVQLAQHLWGGDVAARPRHWRASIRRGLETLSWLHLASDDLDRPPDFGRMTALITHFADLRGSPNDGCDDDCPARGGPPHRHFLVNVGRGFVGCLEQCSETDDETGVRYYDFPARGSRGSGLSLQRLGRRGNLMSMYLPARLGEPAPCKTLTPSQHRLLQAMVREITRRRRRQRREFSEPEVKSDNFVADAQGRYEIACPMLVESGPYLGFNGNGKRRGCGYRLLSDGGWLEKAGYDRDGVLSFVSDLGVLSRRLDLTIVGLVPGTNPPEWLSLDRIRHLAQQPQSNSILRRMNVRIYAAADCLERWNQIFGWPLPSLLSTTKDDDCRAEICRLLEQGDVRRAEVAAGVGVDASLLSKILNGQRRCPDHLVERVRHWLDHRDGDERQPEPDTACTLQPLNGTGQMVAPHLGVALAYRSRGWSVIPQVPSTKQPYIKWKPFQNRLPTEAELEAWWCRWPDAGIALIAGPLSGVLVVDVDGPEAHEALVGRLGVDPAAPQVLSGSRESCRYHLFFRHPDFCTGAKKTPWHPKLEFRGHAGLAVLPPSLHKSGNRYVWAPGRSLEDMSLPVPPLEIVEALRPPQRAASAGGTPVMVLSTEELSTSTRDFLSGMWADGPEWNDRLFRAACDMAARGVARDHAETLLLAGAKPWNSSEEQAARRTIESAFSHPREAAVA